MVATQKFDNRKFKVHCIDAVLKQLHLILVDGNVFCISETI